MFGSSVTYLDQKNPTAKILTWQLVSRIDGKTKFKIIHSCTVDFNHVQKCKDSVLINYSILFDIDKTNLNWL